MKFPAGEKTTPSLVLGEKLIPGSDESHFCKPTDVAVRLDGSAFYVADGYCNGRILMYNPDGEVIRTWGSELSRRKPLLYRLPEHVCLGLTLLV